MNNILLELKALFENRDANLLNTARLLYQVREQRLFQPDFFSFRIFAETCLHTKYRKAMNLAEIYQSFAVALKIPDETLNAIPWSKLVTIRRVVAADPAKWLKMAQDMPRIELEKQVRIYEPKIGFTKKRLYVDLMPDQQELYKTVMEKAGQLTESEVQHVRWEAIFLSFLGGLDAPSEHWKLVLERMVKMYGKEQIIGLIDAI